MAREDHVLVDQSRPTGWRGWVYRTQVHFAVALARTFLFWRIRGAENIPRQGPLLVVANHPSYLDPPTLVALMIYHADRDVSIMAWDKLFKVPLVSFFTRTYKAYPVNRDNPGRGPYVTLVKILQKGGAAGVFPEGSRSHGRLMGTWKPGALRAAFATRATIQPITFVTVGEFWPRASLVPRFFRQHEIVVHPPITAGEYIADMPEGAREKDQQEKLAARIREIINAPILERQQRYEQHMQARIDAADPWRRQTQPAEARRQRREAARQMLQG